MYARRKNRIGIALLLAAAVVGLAPSAKNAFAQARPNGAAPPPIATNDADRKKTDAGHKTIRVYFATDRNATGKDAPNKRFGGERGELRFGVCEVSIPRRHKPGNIESRSVWRLQFRENPDRHVVLKSVQPRTPDAFLSELARSMQMPEGRGDALIFIHGYTVTFRNAARRIAQLSHDLDFKGTPMLYSWPAQGHSHEYPAAETNAKWTRPHLSGFLASVLRDGGAERVHLIAHSLGGRALAEALCSKQVRAAVAENGRFGQIVLAAPDIDAEVFKRDIAPKIAGLAERVSVYVSSTDTAIKVSRRVHGYSRLGEAGERLTVFPKQPGIEVIDASKVDTSWLSMDHTYFSDSPVILNDLRGVFGGKSPAERGLIQRNGCFALR